MFEIGRFRNGPRPVLIPFLHFLLMLVVMFTRRYQIFFIEYIFEFIAHVIIFNEMSMILFTYSSQKDYYPIVTLKRAAY